MEDMAGFPPGFIQKVSEFKEKSDTETIGLIRKGDETLKQLGFSSKPYQKYYKIRTIF